MAFKMSVVIFIYTKKKNENKKTHQDKTKDRKSFKYEKSVKM